MAVFVGFLGGFRISLGEGNRGDLGCRDLFSDLFTLGA